MKTKILCMYLPQFHAIDENSKWWGMGYTEWTAVKNAKPLFTDHNQPRIPLDANYYDLSMQDGKTWAWQADLASKYGVDGFCIYHYWFKGKKLLYKPLEILLENPQINISYCLSWANESWTRTWYGLSKEVLQRQEYGSKSDWIDHFNYLLNFFKDPRYIKVHNMPMLCIYRSADIDQLENMLNLWRKLALDNGFSGLHIVSANSNGKIDARDHLLDAYYNFEPGYTLKHKVNFKFKILYRARNILSKAINKISHNYKMVENVFDSKYLSYFISKNIENTKNPVYKGAFVSWDNTPRMSYKGIVFNNSTPQLLYKNLCNIYKNSQEKDNEFIFLNAWNEWGEGCYLEPDESNEYDYLKSVRESKKFNKYN